MPERIEWNYYVHITARVRNRMGWRRECTASAFTDEWENRWWNSILISISISIPSAKNWCANECGEIKVHFLSTANRCYTPAATTGFMVCCVCCICVSEFCDWFEFAVSHFVIMSACEIVNAFKLQSFSLLRRWWWWCRNRAPATQNSSLFFLHFSARSHSTQCTLCFVLFALVSTFFRYSFWCCSCMSNKSLAIMMSWWRLFARSMTVSAFFSLALLFDTGSSSSGTHVAFVVQKTPSATSAQWHAENREIEINLRSIFFFFWSPLFCHSHFSNYRR